MILISKSPFPVPRVRGNPRFLSLMAFPDVALGKDESVNIFGEDIKFKIPAGTQPGEAIRLRNLGFPHTRGTGKGDLLVRIFMD